MYSTIYNNQIHEMIKTRFLRYYLGLMDVTDDRIRLISQKLLLCCLLWQGELVRAAKGGECLRLISPRLEQGDCPAFQGGRAGFNSWTSVFRRRRVFSRIFIRAASARFRRSSVYSSVERVANRFWQ